MGTTAEKFNYAFGTKDLLKTEINKINNVLDDNSTFRSYPQELFNGYLDILNNGTGTLWNNLEKVSASGEEATLENVETAPMKIDLKGNTSQEADPTPDDPKDIKVVKGENVVSVSGKNLFTTDYLTSNSFTTYTKLSDNSFSFTATGTWKKASYKVPCKPNTNYYFNFSSTSSMYIQIRGVQTGTQIVAVYQAYLTTFNSGENTELQINIDIGQNSIASGTISDIQLEEGTAKTDFVPYSKTDYPINLGDIELCKINTYKDYFHKDSGKWYVHKEIGKKILNGSENWADRQQGSATYLYLKCTLQNGANGGISDKFKYNQSYNAPEEHILVSNEWNEASIVIRKDRLSTPNVANFKSWLSNNNVKLYYVLATPTETEITNSTLIEQLEAIYKAKSVKDKTYITQTNDELPFILDVEAIKEYEVN